MSTFIISIIIPCYNMGELLIDTLDSVESVYDPEKHEVIIVDDGSTDKATINILNNIDKYKIIRQKNGGLSNARNTGIKHAQGNFLLFLDSDNLLTDGYLTKGLDILISNNDIDIVYGESETFGNGKKEKLWARDFNLQLLLTYNYIDACCLVRRSLFSDLGGFDELMKNGYEDWEMWIRAALAQKKFHYLKNVVIQKYRVRPDSMLRGIDKKKSDSIYDYIEQKFPNAISYEGMSNYYYSKFTKNPIGWTSKLFIKKYLPFLYKKLINKGKIRKFL